MQSVSNVQYKECRHAKNNNNNKSLTTSSLLALVLATCGVSDLNTSNSDRSDVFQGTHASTFYHRETAATILLARRERPQ